jgi:hypothetical protein
MPKTVSSPVSSDHGDWLLGGGFLAEPCASPWQWFFVIDEALHDKSNSSRTQACLTSRKIFANKNRIFT